MDIYKSNLWKGFASWSVVEEVALGQVSLRVIWFFLSILLHRGFKYSCYHLGDKQKAC
jgi:hypothetical protein